jgi:hypothetical protein|tara:strand:+ start:44 stop:196 length:153 start_codon:yes stop_codon:yes gene_type:complete
MIKLLVSLMLAFPKIADVFFKVKDEYTKSYKKNRHRRMDKRIDDWLHNSK